jgi:endonuclease III
MFHTLQMMQETLSFGQTNDLLSLRDSLRPVFGEIRDEWRLDPVAQFVRSFIGSRTYDRTSWQAFERLTARYADWDAVADAPVSDIEAALGDVTFADKKARELREALRKIRVRAGAIELDFLAELQVETALHWLEQIPGVGRKIAAATLNFSVLGRRAFVVDVHVIRVLRRFGFVKPNAGTREVYDAVMAAAGRFDAEALYELHWYLKRLGQKACTHFQAACASCALSQSCLRRIEEGVAAQSGRAA